MEFSNNIVEEILTGFIQNELGRIGVNKAVIGLSGGIDSAVSTYLSVKALGNKNVTCLLMPYKSSSPESITDAMKIVKDLKVNYSKIDITSAVDSIINSTGEKNISDLRKGNIMARVRMILLYDESARENSLVIGTSNKTEILLGYSTIFGDSASAVNPIGDLYKTQLISLAEYLGVPESVIKKKPSADLWKGQTDEQELGFTYDEVDKYLQLKVEDRMSEEELIKVGFDTKFMK